MSANSSSNMSVPAPPPVLDFLACMKTTSGKIQTTTFTAAAALLLLPLCVYVLYLGGRRWRQQASHCDVFTYNMAAVELLNVSGSALLCWGLLADLPVTSMWGTCLSFISSNAQTLFHLLTCVERYLAVVHPVTYLGLRNAQGIRNAAIGGAWLVSVVTILTIVPSSAHADKAAYTFIAFVLIIISFCSLSVLCVLIRPGPGEGGGARGQVDQAKLRAFYTIMAILGALVLRIGGAVVGIGLLHMKGLQGGELCSRWLSAIWLSLPSSLILPLLFLQRAGKLLCCKNDKESG